MSFLYFNMACRWCNRSNGLNNALGAYKNDIEYYKSHSDYDISRSISNSLKINNIECEFCGSENFDIYNVKFDDYFIFNLEQLKTKAHNSGSYFYLYNMSKVNNTEGATIETVYKNYDSFKKFELRCKNEIQKLINSLPKSNLIHHDGGVFYACFTGNDSQIQIEKFRYIGFTQEALINISNNIGKNLFEN